MRYQSLKRFFRLLLFPGLILIMFLFNHCNKEEDCPNDSSSQISNLIVSPYELNLSQHGKGKLYLSTYPPIKTTWRIATAAEWLSFSQIEGEINKDVVEVEVTADINKCELGYNTETISIISSSAGRSELYIKYELDSEYSAIVSTTENLLFDFFDETSSFYIKNIGIASAEWSVNNMAPYFTIDPNQGSLNPGDSILLNLSIDRGQLPSADLSSVILIVNEKNDSLNIPVLTRNYIEEKWILYNNVVEADFDKINQKIIVICTDPPGVNILDPIQQTETFISLSNNPINLSLRPQGGKAIIGCDNIVYYVDTESANVIQSYETGVYPKDIVFGPTDWIYVFQQGGAFNYIHNINLSNGEVHITEAGYDDSDQVARLHPSGKFIYTLYRSGSSSTSNVYKFSIENDTTDFLYNISDPDYGFFKNFWIADDGIKLFTYYSSIARCSENQAYDLEYLTSFDLTWDERNAWVDTYTETNILCSIISEEDYPIYQNPKLAFYDYSTFLEIEALMFPSYFVDLDSTGTRYGSSGYFSFFNASGDKVYSILKADEEYPFINDWSVFVCDVPQKAR